MIKTTSKKQTFSRLELIFRLVTLLRYLLLAERNFRRIGRVKVSFVARYIIRAKLLATKYSYFLPEQLHEKYFRMLREGDKISVTNLATRETA